MATARLMPHRWEPPVGVDAVDDDGPPAGVGPPDVLDAAAALIPPGRR